MQWRYQHQKVPPPSLCEHVPSLSPDVEQVVLRALAKRPEERFERVETFALALERAARGEDVSSVLTSSASPKQFNSVPVGKRANVPSPKPPNSIEQLFQEGVRAQASGNIEEALRTWQRVMTTPGIAEKYSTTVGKTIRELHPQIISLRLKQAREASMQGRWQDEIRLWEDLLHLLREDWLALKLPDWELDYLFRLPLTLNQVPKNVSGYTDENLYLNEISMIPVPKGNTITQNIQERLQIARHNEQFAWMYVSAQQFIRNKDNAAATIS